MEQMDSPDAAREIASFRERFKAWRGRGTGITDQRTSTGSMLRPDEHAGQPGKPGARDVSDTVWSDTQWTDTVFDSGER
ncbi:MAG: hypothetical protein Q8R67_19235 [Rhodoferax sp.]|nr:hypothetical protein [Rhodoferax sp.]MDP3653809.1 hypothetical protein [Rhodoferax sp.]